MCPLTLSALLGIASACPPPRHPIAGPSDLLAPANPAIHGHWTPPPSPTAGLKRYVPVDATAKGWLGGNADAAKRPAMPNMPGLSGRGP